MRRDKRQFVVEVKRGPKKDSVKKRLSPTRAIAVAAQAESIQTAIFAPPAEPADNQPQRRILQALEAEADAPVLVEDAPKRRGRKPGSKNKPKVVDTAPARRRGRPPKNAGGAVRTVSPTQAVVDAALEAISRNANPAPTGSRTMFPTDPTAPAATGAASPDQPVKRGRGRPRKIIPPGGFPPKIPEWVTWSQAPDEAPVEAEAAEAAAEPAVVEKKAIEPLAPIRPSTATIIALHERVGRPRAGMRWTRRLRGIAALSQRRVRNA